MESPPPRIARSYPAPAWWWAKARGQDKKRRASPPWMYSAAAAPIHYAAAWTDNRSEQVLHFKEVVFKAVNAIATMAAGQTPNVSRSTTGPGPLSVSRSYRRKVLTPIQHHEELEPADPNHPLCRLLYDVNEVDTTWDLWYETVMFLLLTGSSYWWVPSNSITTEHSPHGLPAEVWVIPAHWVWPVAGKDRLVDHYEIRSVPGGGRAWKLPEHEVIHFRRTSPISKLDGWSHQTAGALSIDLYESIRRSQFWAMKNGVNPGLAVEFDSDYQEPDDEDLDRIERKFMARYSGENRSQRPMLVPPGASVKPLTHTPKEMDFVVASEHSEESVLSLFGVPSIVLGKAKNMTYGSVAAAQLGFCSFTVNPLLTFLGVQATQKLAWRFGPEYRIWFADCTPDDPAMLEKEVDTDLRNGVRTPNEVRRQRGLPPYPHGGDDPFIAAVGTQLGWGTGQEHQFLGRPAASPGGREDS